MVGWHLQSLLPMVRKICNKRLHEFGLVFYRIRIDRFEIVLEPLVLDYACRVLVNRQPLRAWCAV
jgi:hypothetical protein